MLFIVSFPVLIFEKVTKKCHFFMESPIFRPKIILVGEAGSGKTKFISRFAPSDLKKVFLKRYGVFIYTFTVETSLGPIEYSIWDTCGQERLGILRDGYFNEAHGVIYFFDLTNRETYIRLPRWHTFTASLCGKVSTIVCATKVDSKDRVIPIEKTLFHRRLNLPYIEVSSTTNYHVQEALLELTRTMLDTPELTFTNDIPLLPPEQEIDQQAMEIAEKNIEDANKKITVDVYSTVPNPMRLGINRTQEQFMDYAEDLIHDLDN